MASAWRRRAGTERARGRRGERGPRPKDRQFRLDRRLEELEARLVLNAGIDLSIADPVAITEGNSGTTDLVFVVTRSGDLNSTLNVSYSTSNGTATAGADYTGVTAGTLTIPAGASSAEIRIPVIGDTLDEIDETFTVTLTGAIVTDVVGPPPAFAAGATFATGTRPITLAHGDLNGDGRPDLAIANATADSISVLLNQTAPGATVPSYAPQGTFAVGDFPISVAIGDVNGDGLPDLVTVDVGSDTVSVLLNQTAPGATAPSFAPRATFASPDGPDDVALGDFNGDGRPDIAVANRYTNPPGQPDSVSVLLNQTVPGSTTASFAAQATFVAGDRPESIAVADFNGDGRPDLAVGSLSSGIVSVFLNQTQPGAAAASFAAQVTFTAVGAFSVAAGDLNGDGRPDLAVVNLGADAVSVFLNQTAPGATAPSFAPAATFAAGPAAAAVAIEDVNGDFRPDLVVSNPGGVGTVSVFSNRTQPGATAPSFAAQATFAAGLNARLGPLADVNGDGRPDVVVVNYSSAFTATVLLNTTPLSPPTPGFGPQATFPTVIVPNNRPHDVVAGDLNGDGRPDLVNVNGYANLVEVRFNQTAPGAPTPSFGAASSFAAPSFPIAVAVGDLNGDGLPDLATANRDASSVAVLLNQTTPGATAPSFAAQVAFLAGTRPGFVAIGDVNGDGLPDLAVSNYDSDDVSVLLNQTAPGATAPSFAAAVNFPVGVNPVGVALADVNGDGRPDLIAANFVSDTVSVRLNQTAPGATAPSFGAQSTFAAGDGAFGVSVGDLNGDGLPDLAVANINSTTVSVLLNRTTPGATAPSFVPQTTFAVGDNPSTVTIGDLDGDGRPDLAVSNRGSNTVSVLLNTEGPASLFTIDWDPDGSLNGLALGTLGTYRVTLTSTDGPANGGGTFATNFATGLGTNDVPGITDPTVLAEAAGLDWNPGAAGTATIDFGGGVVQDPIVLINFTDAQVLTFDFADALTVVVLDANPPGSVTIAPGNVVTTAGGNANGGNDGFAIQLLGSFTSITFATNVNLDTTINSVGITVGVRTATFAASFAPQATFATGTDPRNVVIADFNGDFRPDLAVDNTGADNNLGVLLNSPPVVITDGTAVGTILDDDPPPLVSLSLTGSPLAEAGGVATVTATLSAASGQDVTVTLGFSGTATVVADYTRSGTVIAIPAGSTSGSVTITGVDDLIDEADETVVVDITAVTNGTEDGEQQVMATITDDDAPPNVSINDVTVVEAAGTAIFTISLDAPSGQLVFVSALTADGTATATADYGAVGAGFIFMPGVTSQTFEVPIVDDALDEADETFFVNITATNATVADAQGVGTITDDDPPPVVSLSLAGSPLPEAGGVATVTATLSAVSGLDVTVTVGFSGTATVVADYTRSGTVIVIPAGSTSGSVTITGVDDALDEADETVIVDITAVTNGTEDGEQQVTATITDDDPPPSVTINDVTVLEGDSGTTPGTFTVTLSQPSGQDVTVFVTLNSGTATFGSDFSAFADVFVAVIPAGATSFSFDVDIIGDVLFEGDETFTADIGATNATVADGQGLGTIVDDDPPPLVRFTTASQTGGEGAGTLTVTVQLSAVSGLDVTVPFTVGGTATGGGTDYAITASPVVIPAGATTATITIAVLNDAADEPDETVQLTIGTPTNAVLAVPIVHIATITDNDPTVTIRFASSSQGGSEGAGPLTAIVLLSEAAGLDITVPFSGGGTATTGTDYTITTSPLVIPAGMTSGTITITLVDDAVDEASETVVLTLGTPTNALLGAVTVDTATITDNDPPVARNDLYAATEDTPLAVAAPGVLLNDSGLATGQTYTAVLVAAPQNGTVLLNPDGSFTYTPTANYSGPDSFTYRAGDGTAASNVATVGLLVAGVNDAPTAVVLSPSATALNEGDTLTLGVSFTDPDAGDAHTVRIAWGDGTPDTVQVLAAGVTGAGGIAHTYADNSPPGGPPFTVTVTVSEPGGSAAMGSQAITVANVAPTLILSGAGTVQTGIAVYTLGLSASDPGADTIASWTIDWGDGTVETVPGSATAVTHVFARCATYTISATATDEDGTFAAGNTLTVVADLATRNQCFVAQVYADLLGRPVDGVGLPFWSAELDRGVSRAEVVNRIEQFPEARAAQVQGYYRRFLGREADGPGLAAFTAALLDGSMRSEDVIAAIVGSPEYFANAGGTNDAFLERAYVDLLGRPIDGVGRAGWTAALAGGMTRSQVARAIVQSEEGRRAAVEGFYRRFLLRSADGVGLPAFAGALGAGATYEQVIALIVGSVEYLDRFVPA